MAGQGARRKVSWQPFAAVALAAGVVLGALIPVGVLVVVLVLDSGWSRVIWAVLLSIALWQLMPRPERPSARAVTLAGVEYPALHLLVTDVAEVAGARAPTSVRSDTVFATSVIPVGYLGGAALVIGLPQWTALGREERVASVAHALVCARVLRLPSGCLVRLADDILVRASLLLTSSPDPKPHEGSIAASDSGLGMLGAGDELAGDRARREAAAFVGSAGLSVVGGPVRAVRRVLRRAARPSVTRACLRADHRAVNIVGERAVESLLRSSLQTPRG